MGTLQPVHYPLGCVAPVPWPASNTGVGDKSMPVRVLKINHFRGAVCNELVGIWVCQPKVRRLINSLSSEKSNVKCHVVILGVADKLLVSCPQALFQDTGRGPMVVIFRSLHESRWRTLPSRLFSALPIPGKLLLARFGMLCLIQPSQPALVTGTSIW